MAVQPIGSAEVSRRRAPRVDSHLAVEAGRKRPGEADTRLPDLIFVSLEDWDEVWRRNQFVCAELARRDPDLRIVFVGLPRNVTHAARTGRLLEVLRRPATYRVPGVEGVTVTHPLKPLPETLRLGRWVNDAVFRLHVRRVVRDLGLRRPALWLNAHSAVHMAGRVGEAGVVYDVTDDWTSLDQPAAVRRRTVAQDADLCRRADAVIVCSQRLYDLKAGTTRSLHLIPNGVDADHYRTVDDPATSAPPAAGWPRPVLGYTGTVHPDRVDVGMIRAVAQRWPGSVVLVGPDHLRPDDLAALDLPNVRRVGPVAYGQVPAYMAGFDACIVPHRVTPFTESLNPIKLWEYLAAGKPIVSTPVAGFRDFPHLVRLAGTADEFLAAAHAAVAEVGTDVGLRLRDQRRAVARDHSWEKRVDNIVGVLRSVAGGGGTT